MQDLAPSSERENYFPQYSQKGETADLIKAQLQTGKLSYSSLDTAPFDNKARLQE